MNNNNHNDNNSNNNNKIINTKLKIININIYNYIYINIYCTTPFFRSFPVLSNTGPSNLSQAQARTLSGAHARKKPAPGTNVSDASATEAFSLAVCCVVVIKNMV